MRSLLYSYARPCPRSTPLHCQHQQLIGTAMHGIGIHSIAGGGGRERERERKRERERERERGEGKRERGEEGGIGIHVYLGRKIAVTRG